MNFIGVICDWVGGMLGDIFRESFTEFGFQELREMFRWPRKRHEVWRIVGFLALGMVMGGLSVFVFPSALIEETWVRVVTLLVAPLAGGCGAISIGCWGRYQNQERVRLD